MEALPGDTISCNTSLFGRLATPLKPIMDNMFLETYFFSVPYRQLWSSWVKFNGEQTNPGDSTDFAIPVCTGAAQGTGTLWDYFALPINIDPDNLPVSSLPFRAYNQIYNEWFRDQNLISSAARQVSDSNDNLSNYPLRKKRKRFDYFTSALPWPQKGPAVTVNLGGLAPIQGLGFTVNASATNVTSPSVFETGGEVTTYGTATLVSPAVLYAKTATTGAIGALNLPQIYADMSNATGLTINELRESFQIQRLLERDARGGTRYPEILMAHFGVIDPQMLVLQRPEFLGGGTSMININPVAQSSGSPAATEYTDTPQGNLAAYGTVSGHNHGFTKSFTEHCLIIGIVCVRADLTYQQGVERMWDRSTRYDFAWPALSHLGEQAIKNREIFAQGTAEDELTFGYQERFAEYRFIPSKITGLFRSAATASLDVWHLAQEFATLPVLDQTFIEENIPIDRVVAVPTEPDMLLDAYFKIRAARPLPLYGTPGLIDHF